MLGHAPIPHSLPPAGAAATLGRVGLHGRDSGHRALRAGEPGGLPIDDLRLCAGVPDREATSPAGLFWTYDRSPPSASVSLPVPVVGGAVNLSRGADCRVTFQLVDGHVARIGHSTGTARGLAQDPACAPVIRACLRMVNPNPEPETPEPAAAIRR